MVVLFIGVFCQKLIDQNFYNSVIGEEKIYYYRMGFQFICEEYIQGRSLKSVRNIRQKGDK